MRIKAYGAALLILLFVFCIPNRTIFVDGVKERDAFVQKLKEQNTPYTVIPRDNDIFEIKYQDKVK